MNISFEFPPGTTHFQAIQILEKRSADNSTVNLETIMTKINLLLKCAKMIFKMLLDPLYFQNQDFGQARRQKFLRVSSLCKIYHQFFLIKQLKNQEQFLKQGWLNYKTKNKTQLAEAENMLKKLEIMVTKIENSSEDLSLNLALNIAQLCDIATYFTSIDLLCANHVYKMLKEKVQPQNQ